MFPRFIVPALLACAVVSFACRRPLHAQAEDGSETETAPSAHFTGADLFGLSVASDPQISPGWQRDRLCSRHQRYHDRCDGQLDLADRCRYPRTRSPSSPAKDRTAARAGRPMARGWPMFSTESGGGPELHVRWLGKRGERQHHRSARSARQHRLVARWIAHRVHRPGAGRTAIAGQRLRPKPEGAEWKPGLEIIDRVTYRFDGAGYLKTGFTHVFLVDADGGAPPPAHFGGAKSRGHAGMDARRADHPHQRQSRRGLGTGRDRQRDLRHRPVGRFGDGPHRPGRP